MEFFMRAYKNYANFSGRDTRQQYWMFYLFYIIFVVVFGFVDPLIGAVGLLNGIFILVSIIPSVALATRRLHDIGKSGWWQLLALIPVVGSIVLLVFLVKQGDPGENQFGPNPLNDVNIK